MSSRFIMSSAIFIGVLVLLSAGVTNTVQGGLDVTSPTSVESCDGANSSGALFSCGVDTFGGYIGTLTELAGTDQAWLALVVFVPLALTGIYVVIKAIIPG